MYVQGASLKTDAVFLTVGFPTPRSSGRDSLKPVISFIAIAVLGTGACEMNNNSSLNAGAAGELQTLLTPDLLGQQVAYLEKQIGPAMKIEGARRTYMIGGCRLTLLVDNSAVSEATLYPSQRCNPKLDAIAGGVQVGAANAITFRSFRRTHPKAVWGAECIVDCSLEARGVYVWAAPDPERRTTGMLVKASWDEGRNAEAVKAWRSRLTAEHGSSYVDGRSYSCDPAEYSRPPDELAKVKAEEITFGAVRSPLRSCPRSQGAVFNTRQSPSSDLDQTWHFVGGRDGRCRPLESLAPGARTPDDFYAETTRDGARVNRKSMGANLVVFSQEDDPNAPVIILARGRAHCLHLARGIARRHSN